MKPNGTPKTLFALVAALLVVPFGALAQEEYASVRNLEGTAQVVGARDTQPQDLTLNTPLMEGDTLWTSRGGRLEVFLQDGNRIWLDYDSRLEITQIPTLDPSAHRTLQARLWKGSALLDLQAEPVGGAPYWIATPSTTVTASERGLYLIEVENVDRTRVTALEGRCDVASSGQAVRLERMQMTYSEYGYAPTPARDAGALPASSLLAFRDDHLPRPVRGGDSRRYLPETLSAYSADFDAYGTWSYAGNYGYVWRPSPAYISVGWAPYRHGRWCYRPWGVTWIPFEPWGWCHAHFGRWIFMVGFGWSWVPGHIFSPAWVSWYWGDGWIGWSPWGWDSSWGYGGWCSVNITNLYVNNVTTVIVNHTEPPPPPVQPKPWAPAPGAGKGLNPDVRPGPGGPIHITPGAIEEYRKGRLDLAGLRKGLDGPGGLPASSPSGWVSGRPANGKPSDSPLPGGIAARPDRGAKEDGATGSSTRFQPGTRPQVEPSGGTSRPEPSPWAGSGTRTEPTARPKVEPPSGSSQPESSPWAESPTRTQPNARPSYEPPASPTRPEPAPSGRPSYEPPSSPRPEPSPWVQSPTRTQPSERPSYEPPAVHESPRTVPSRVEPKPTPTPAPSSPPASSGGSGNKTQDKDHHRRGFGRG